MPRRVPPKRKGELAELRFWTEATRRGMIVSKPYGDSAQYDFVVDCAGKLSRVQVKSSARRRDRHDYHVNCHRAYCRPYGCRAFEILAIYLVPCRTWFLIPSRWISRLKGLRISLKQNTRYARFKERWDLLGGASRRKRTNAHTCDKAIYRQSLQSLDNANAHVGEIPAREAGGT